MTKISEDHPPAHARYVVMRNGYLFTATPCYGMHNPWWVVLTMEREVDPVPMNENDEWIPLEEVQGRLEGKP